jgi:cytohesin
VSIASELSDVESVNSLSSAPTSPTLDNLMSTRPVSSSSSISSIPTSPAPFESEERRLERANKRYSEHDSPDHPSDGNLSEDASDYETDSIHPRHKPQDSTSLPRSKSKRKISSTSSSTSSSDIKIDSASLQLNMKKNKQTNGILGSPASSTISPLFETSGPNSFGQFFRAPSVVDARKDTSGRTRLFKCVHRGDVTSVKNLIYQGANVNHKDNAGWTPLHEAVLANHIGITQILLESGADPNARGLNGNTPLHDADSFDYLEVAKLLLRYGASVECRNDDGLLPLQNPELDTPMKSLLSHYSSIEDALLRRDEMGMALIQRSCWERDAELVHELVACRKVDVNVSDNAGWTPLHECVANQDVALVKLLLAHGADPNASGYKGITPLHAATKLKNLELIKNLISHGGDPGRKDDKGETPLDLASPDSDLQGALSHIDKHNEDIPMLPDPWIHSSVKSNAGPLLEDDDGKSERDERASWTSSITTGVKDSPDQRKLTREERLMQAYIARIEREQEKGVSSTNMTKEPSTKRKRDVDDGHVRAEDLPEYCKAGDIRRVTNVLRGEYPQTSTGAGPGAYMPRAVLAASKSGYLEIVRMLMERVVQLPHLTPHALHQLITSAMHHAVKEGHVDVASYMLSRGASLRAKNRAGRTALQQAKAARDPAMITLIEEVMRSQEQIGGPEESTKHSGTSSRKNEGGRSIPPTPKSSNHPMVKIEELSETDIELDPFGSSRRNTAVKSSRSSIKLKKIGSSSANNVQSNIRRKPQSASKLEPGLRATPNSSRKGSPELSVVDMESPRVGNMTRPQQAQRSAFTAGEERSHHVVAIRCDTGYCVLEKSLRSICPGLRFPRFRLATSGEMDILRAHTSLHTSDKSTMVARVDELLGWMHVHQPNLLSRVRLEPVSNSSTTPPLVCPRTGKGAPRPPPPVHARPNFRRAVGRPRRPRGLPIVLPPKVRFKLAKNRPREFSGSKQGDDEVSSLMDSPTSPRDSPGPTSTIPSLRGSPLPN